MNAASDVWTPAEVHLALSKMSDADIFRLKEIASRLIRVKGGPMESDDLLNTALVKVLEGARTIPRTDPLVVVLANAMRSILSNERKRHHNSRASAHDIDKLNAIDGNTPESLLIAKEQENAQEEVRKELLGLFDDDENTKLIFEGYYFEGMTAQELRDLTGLSQTAYESKKKAILRRLRKFTDERVLP